LTVFIIRNPHLQCVEKRQAVHIYRNVEALSRNNFCRGKAINIKYYEYVNSAPYYLVFCGLSVCTIFFHFES